jgi:hypothetical protein
LAVLLTRRSNADEAAKRRHAPDASRIFPFINLVESYNGYSVENRCRACGILWPACRVQLRGAGWRGRGQQQCRAGATADITEGGLVVSPNENNRRIDAFRMLLSTAPTPGTNTILITHKPNIVDALGKDWFDVKEGEASIFRPENGSYKFIARVQMEEWPHLAAAAK